MKPEKKNAMSSSDRSNAPAKSGGPQGQSSDKKQYAAKADQPTQDQRNSSEKKQVDADRAPKNR